MLSQVSDAHRARKRPLPTSVPEGRKLLSAHEAFLLTGTSVKQFNKWRFKGGGPVFKRYGRMVKYLRADLSAFFGVEL